MHDETDIGRRAVVRLQVEHDELCFVVQGDGSATKAKSFRAGSLVPVRKVLRHEPVTAAELEAAIAAVEDLIMPVIRSLPSVTCLEIPGAAMSQVAQAIPASAKRRELSIEAVELLYNRLADVANGMPARSLGIPVSASFALSLVLLREVMHHGGYRLASVLPCPETG